MKYHLEKHFSITYIPVLIKEYKGLQMQERGKPERSGFAVLLLRP
jgi:hypothetical protein